MGCQICDDVKNGKFRNGFVVYMCGNDFTMASMFQDDESIVPIAYNLAKKTEQHINAIIEESERRK